MTWKLERGETLPVLTHLDTGYSLLFTPDDVQAFPNCRNAQEVEDGLYATAAVFIRPYGEEEY